MTGADDDRPPPCDCGHAFSINPTWWHLGNDCAYRRWFAERGELEQWRKRGPLVEGEEHADD